MTIASADFDFIRRLVYDQAGIVLEPGKEYLVDSRLLPLCRREGFASIDELLRRLRAAGAQALAARVVDAMTTNETTFFRDVDPFEALKRHVIPGLIEARRSARRLSIWYAASSTGQEPYSLSMMLDAEFPELRSWDIHQIATDISPTVLDRAREGRYTQLEVNRGLPARYLVNYFTKVGNDWQLKDSIRNMVRFQELNLVKSWPAIGPFDIVMIRNVMIFFDVDAKRDILRRVRSLLRPDGFMFLGGAETTMNLDESFDRMHYERAGCYRLRSVVPSLVP